MIYWPFLNGPACFRFPKKNTATRLKVLLSSIISPSVWKAKIKDRLEAAGFEVSEAIDHGFIHSIYAFDPNGIPIEFSHNAEGIDIRRDPIMTDSAPSKVAREGPEPNGEVWPPVKNPTPKNRRKVYPGVGSELFHGIRK
jgi:hypothetical protein